MTFAVNLKIAGLYALPIATLFVGGWGNVTDNQRALFFTIGSIMMIALVTHHIYSEQKILHNKIRGFLK